MAEEFMKRPTEVLASYMAANTDQPERYWMRRMGPGRIAMAMELITVIRILESIQIAAEHEQTISVLQTLLVDQQLAELGAEWYSKLSEWRRIKTVIYEPGVGEHVGIVQIGAQPSAVEAPPSAELPLGNTDAQPCIDQTTDPPSSD